MEEPVTFRNKKGNKLFGIIHLPEKSHVTGEKIGINLLNPGIKYRVAPNRLNIKIARRLCSEGYYVFRFDPEGIGDSEGNLFSNELLPDVFERVHTGSFISDTIDANDFLINNYGIENLTLIGNCGGAITALLASQKDTRVNRLILIDVPIQLRKAKQAFADKVVAGGEIGDRLFFKYLKRLGNPAAWARFFTFKTDYFSLYKIVKMKLMSLMPKSQNEKQISRDFELFCEKNSLNRYFFRAFRSVAENEKPSLFISAGNDKSTEFFQHYFLDKFLVENPALSKYSENFVVNNANHIYTLYESQYALINKISDWLKEAE